MHRPAAIFGLLALCAAASGCGFIHRTEEERKGFGDRCAEVVRGAMAPAEIDIVRATAQSPEITMLVARVDAVRKDRPEGDPARELAAECQFDHAVLSGFHWTRGGPVH